MSIPPLVPARTIHDGPTCPECGQEPDYFGEMDGVSSPAEFFCGNCMATWPAATCMTRPGVVEICDEPGEHYPECRTEPTR